MLEIGLGTGAGGSVGGSVDLGLKVLGLRVSQVGASLGEVHGWLMGGLPAGVLNAVSRNHIPFMPLDILICLFLHYLFPPHLRASASIP